MSTEPFNFDAADVVALCEHHIESCGVLAACEDCVRIALAAQRERDCKAICLGCVEEMELIFIKGRWLHRDGDECLAVAIKKPA